jgi:putative CocE/NonD family hydrolase
MRKKSTTLGLLGLGAVGVGLYRFRRKVFGRLLHLRPSRYEVAVRRGLQIPMPDGVNLIADHYIPKGDRLFPTILIRTPYGRGHTVGLPGVMPNFLAQRFAERGYNVIVQDVRGRFDSQGEFEPYVNEASDGRTTLDWIENQTWFNGLLGMWGQSYMGYVQWAVASRAPLYLKALVPSITGSSLPTSGMLDGVFNLDAILRMILQLDAMDRDSHLGKLTGLLRIYPRNQERILKRTSYHLPLGEADLKVVDRPSPFYRKWLAHPELDDPYWKSVDFHSQLDEVTASAHMISGWYDIFLRELLSDYASLQASGQTPYLTIGPWTHLDPECMWESLRQGIVWFDAILKGDRRRLRKLPVRIYVMGANEWREMEAWPPSSKLQDYYLSGDGTTGGQLSDQKEAGKIEPDTYLYDPSKPTPAVGGAMMNAQAGPQDNRSLEDRQDVLTYSTRELESDLEIIGSVRLIAYIHSTRPYTDFFARLCDVYPDGRSINICDGLLRLSPETGIVQSDGSRRIEINLWPMANRFLSGHRIRLQISSGAFPRWNRNLGNGEPIVSAKQLFPAQQTIYHDSDHPSMLVLPVTYQ